MRYYISIFLILIIGSGCGFLQSRKAIDPLVREKVTLFEDIYDTDVSMIYIRMLPTEKFNKRFPVHKDDHAFCRHRFPDSPKFMKAVYLKSEIIEDDYTIEEAVFHELSHCKFDLGHDDSKMKGKIDGKWYWIAESIMFKGLMDARIYHTYQNYYRQELGKKIEKARK